MVEETWGQSQVRVIPKTLKMVLDTSLLNTQQYKERIKGKVEHSRERSSALPLHLGVVAIEKGAFWLPSTKVANFTYFILLLSPTHWFSGYSVRQWPRRPRFNLIPKTQKMVFDTTLLNT